MASQFPNRPPGETPQERRAFRRTGFGWVWLWIWIWIVIILILIFWFGGWGWGRYGGWWWGRRGRVTETYRAPLSGPGVAVLNATNKQPFVGQSFRVNNVPVQEISSNHAIWVGTRNSAPMLVVLAGTENSTANANVSQGVRVDVTGTVEKAPAAAQAKSQWSLSDDETKQLEQQGAYVQATQVQTTRY